MKKHIVSTVNKRPQRSISVLMALCCGSALWATTVSAVTVSLSFNPLIIINGSNTVLTAVPSGGAAPYTYQYQTRLAGATNWGASGMTSPTNIFAWPASRQYRARVVDSARATSVWSAAATLIVRQPGAAVTLSPSVVTQGQSSVASALATNVTLPVTYQWQQNTTTNPSVGWTNVVGSGSDITNVWPVTVNVRARSVDANSVTSGWSTAATLTVLPTEIAATLEFIPSNVVRGVASSLTTVATNGTPPYTYSYAYRWNGTGTWTTAGFTTAVKTYPWWSNLEYRVRVTDTFGATSQWVAAFLRVSQPGVAVAVSPEVVTQSQFSVVSATVSNATLPVAFQWQQNTGSGWTTVAGSGSAVTSAWASTVDVRARSIDANSVTSDWSAAATLTVMPSEIAATLTFNPSNMVRGVASTMTAVPTNGTAPYRYRYEYRWGGEGTWRLASMTSAVTTYAWYSNLEYRVRVTDSFNATSAWTMAFLTVRQPEVTVAFSPSVVTQSQSSVASAVVSNATLPVTYQWQQNTGSGWTSVAGTGSALTNVWPATVDYRARTIDANSITSDWSAAATLTVMPSEIAASLVFNPTSIVRGASSTLTASPTNGTAPYRYSYEYRWGGEGSWIAASSTSAVNTLVVWSNMEYRVRVADSFNSTSAWATAFLAVRQPEVTVAFSPTVVTQSQYSVVSASVANVTAPVVYEWQQNTTTNPLSGWTAVPGIGVATYSNAWAATVQYRARSLDANRVTSDWSTAATLMVMPSEIAATLVASPTNMLRGSNSVSTATATNGTAPYTYVYQYRYGAGEWTAASWMSGRVQTNAWPSNVDLRVQVVDSFSSTSAWATAAVAVIQPAVTVSFSPAVVTQSQVSVVSAVVSNASLPVTYVWQENSGGGWSNVASSARQITNFWPNTVDYRARSVDANNVTSEWSAASTLTVMPSAIAVALVFSPTNTMRGSNSVSTATASSGMAPYSYSYAYRYGTDTWTSASWMSDRVHTNAWASNTELRVQVVDSFNATSAWTVASLGIRQPRVIVAFSPSVVTQSRVSVLSAVVSNTTAPLTYEWQKDEGGGWTNVVDSGRQITNFWPASVDYRARTVDGNSITSEWSAAATLTVMPSIISVALTRNPTNYVRGTSNSVSTASATNGMAPFNYSYEYRYEGGSWSPAAWMSGQVITNAWPSNVELRVQAVDSFNATSAWTAVGVQVRQPLVTVTFSPSIVTQSQVSVASAVVTNASLPVTYVWQENSGGGWSNVASSARQITNFWPNTVDYRARTIDANSITSEWSAVATLPVMPSVISVALAFSSTSTVRGVSCISTATASKGMAPYTYNYEYTYGTDTWTSAAGMNDRIHTNAWLSNVMLRVKVVDSFNATSAWTVASTVTRQPVLTVSFSPSVVTQSRVSVVSANATNTTAPVTYEWQEDSGGGWSNVASSARQITNFWPNTVDYRARTIDANSITSEWSAAATLTVMPSIISVALTRNPTNYIRGASNSVSTASATNGMAPYTYSYEYRYEGGSWTSAPWMSGQINTNAWTSNVELRVQAVDTFNATSAWTAVGVMVRQPLVTVSFSPSVVTQSRVSVVSAVLTNATLPATYEWQEDSGGGWSNVASSARQITNFWPNTVDYRARTIDANSITSEWSAAATLTVMPSIISVALTRNPTNYVRGTSNSVSTASATNGMAPYTYNYEYRHEGGEWATAAWMGGQINTNAWTSNVELRVQAVDTFNATSAWSSVGVMVRQPLVTVSFSPVAVTQCYSSVASAVVTNATLPVNYEWQQNYGPGWTDVSGSGSTITNIWPTNVACRARTIDANSVTSEWSAAANLTILPSAISATLTFNPLSVNRGSNCVLTATATNGMAPYTFSYEYRYDSEGWTEAAGMTAAVTTNAWASNVEYRVQVMDSFGASAWATAALVVRQPSVTVAFSPASVAQSRSSVVSATATNTIEPVTFEWQQNSGSGWANVADSGSAITNVWPATIQYRARSVDANSLTSGWSDAATLTVLPSEIAASLEFNPTTIIRGSNTVMTASATSGTAPYRYSYQYRWGGTGTWNSASITSAVTTYAWYSNLEYRVRAVDSFNATSAWAAATLTVLQPAVSVAFAPSVITQSQSSVVSALATNVTLPVTFQWQQNLTTNLLTGWTNVVGSGDALTNVWPATVQYRARSVDANTITSDWSAAATLTVMPSAISATLEFNPTTVIRGSNSVMTATATNGTAPYRYSYEYRWGGAGSWVVAGVTSPVTTYAWRSNLEYRVRVVDSFNATSAWAAATLTVLQPAVSLAFSPTQVVYGASSVLSATVSNTVEPYVFQFETRATGAVAWSSSPIVSAVTTNQWLSGVEYRARVIDANSVISEWSAVAVLSVLDPPVSVSLALNTNQVSFGNPVVVTATPVGGTGPYVFEYQSKDITVPGYDWVTEDGLTNAVVTNTWYNDVSIRVRVWDMATTNLSYWSPAVNLVVLAPESRLASPVITGLGIGARDSAALPKGQVGAEGTVGITVSWDGSAGKEFSIHVAEAVTGPWRVHPDAQYIQGQDGPMSLTILVDEAVPAMFFRVRERELVPAK